MTLPVILEVAVNGATRRATNPHVPVTPTEIAADCLSCLAAGAAVVHHHDDPRAFSEPGPAGMAALSHETFALIQAERPDALMYPTANFGAPDIAARWDHHRLLHAAGVLRRGDSWARRLGMVATLLALSGLAVASLWLAALGW